MARDSSNGKSGIEQQLRDVNGCGAERTQRDAAVGLKPKPLAVLVGWHAGAMRMDGGAKTEEH